MDYSVSIDTIFFSDALRKKSSQSNDPEKLREVLLENLDNIEPINMEGIEPINMEGMNTNSLHNYPHESFACSCPIFILQTGNILFTTIV